MFTNIANTFANCFKIPELKSRIIFTLIVLAICRLGVDDSHSRDRTARRLQDFFDQQAAAARAAGCWACTACSPVARLRTCAVGALGIMPYISATIIIQLLTRGDSAA